VYECRGAQLWWVPYEGAPGWLGRADAAPRGFANAPGEGLAAAVARAGAPLALAETRAEPRFREVNDAAAAALARAPSLWVPLRGAGGRVAAVAALFAPPAAGAPPEPLTEGELAAAARLLAAAAPGLAAAAHLQGAASERQRWRAVERAVVPLFSAASPAQCREQARDAAAALLGLVRCHAWAVDAAREALVYKAEGLGGAVAAREVTLPLAGPDAVARAARSGEVALQAPPGADAAPHADVKMMPGSGAGALAVVPLTDSAGRALAVLVCERAAEFAPDEVEVLLELAAVAGVAAEHAALLDAGPRGGPGACPDGAHARMLAALTVGDAMREIIRAATRACRCGEAVMFWPGQDGRLCEYSRAPDGEVRMRQFVTAGPKGIAAACVAQAEPLLLPDARHHPAFHADMDAPPDAREAPDASARSSGEPKAPGREPVPLPSLGRAACRVRARGGSEAVLRRF